MGPSNEKLKGKTRTTTSHGPNLIKNSIKSNLNVKSQQEFSKSKLISKTNKNNNNQSDTNNFKNKYNNNYDDTDNSNNNNNNNNNNKRKIDEEQEPEKRVIINSILNAPDEIDFPRGGGTNLTQVEVREAQLEGAQEAMQDDEVLKAKIEEGKIQSKSKRRKLERASLLTSGSEKSLLPKDAFRVEHLNYKRLIPTTKVLAQIILIRPLELIVSLPNQLLGHIPITNISKEYSTRLEEYDEDTEEEDLEEDKPNGESVNNSSKVPTLDDLFDIGQWLSCIVVDSKSSESTPKFLGREGDENVKASRRIELSTEPEKVNEGIARADLRAGFILNASVNSIEDHGYILSLGLPSLTSFVSFKDAQKLQPRRLEIGQLVSCRLKEMNENGRTCIVAIGRAEIIGSSLLVATSISSILPSTLVTALVTATLSTGLNVKFLGYFTGTIDLFHLNNAQNPQEDFKVGQKVKARVIWDSLNSGSSSGKKFALSLNQAVLDMSVTKLVLNNATSDTKNLVDEFPVGKILEDVIIVRIDEEWGLSCLIEEAGISVPAFVHISRITDDHLATIPRNGPWKVGTHHKARVIGFSAVDGLVQLSLQPSILEKSFLRVVDVKIGEVIKGTIKRLSDTAMFVAISGNVDGVVWPIHYSDIKLKHPEKKFKIGSSVKARIFSVDPNRNRVVLTLKKQLIDSELPLITSIDTAKVGIITHGTVTKIMDKGVLVDFFGGMRGLIPASEAADEYTSDLSKLFIIGKVLPVRIISVDIETSRIIASAKQAITSLSVTAGKNQSIEIGNIISGEISALHESNIIILLQPSQIKALMSYSTLSRHRRITIEALKNDLAIGQILEDLVVVSKNEAKGFVIVGLVPSKAPIPSLEGTVPTNVFSFESLCVGQNLQGRICGKTPTGLLVQVSKGVRGRVCKTETVDDYDTIESNELSIGNTVDCIVLSVDIDNRRVDLSLRNSRLKNDIAVADISVKEVKDLKVGQTIRGFIKSIVDHGVFVSLGSTVTARVQIKELFDEYVKDWKPKFAVGQLVEGKVTGISKSQNQVELSLRKNVKIKEALVGTSDLKKGQVVKGVVRRVEAYGAFIKIDGSDVSGLCHKSKVTDDASTSWTEFVHEGDVVTAVIIDVNSETHKVSLGLKASLFLEGKNASDLSMSAHHDQEEEEELQEGDDETGDSEDEGSEGEALDIDSDEASGAEDLEVEQIVYKSTDAQAPLSKDSMVHTVKGINSTTIAVTSSLDWNGEDQQPTLTPFSEDSDSEEELPLHLVGAKGLSNSTLPFEDITGNLDNRSPTTIIDFERLILGTPNSSYTWIQFIAFYLGLSQIDEARKIARRALQTITFREEQEKLNVWVALLNLEHSYGTPQTLEEVFKESAQSNDSKTIHLKMVDIYERSGNFEAEEDLFKRTVKKFGQSSKVWTLFGQFYLSQSKFIEARELLPRALKSLEKRKHVKTISKFAQLEFKLGDAERGRTIFEGIVDSYPKRLDLWFVYIDMEIKQNNATSVRALFDRILTQKLSSKKGKSVFKKWLGFEKEHGDTIGVEACKAKALEFVASIQS